MTFNEDEIVTSNTDSTVGWSSAFFDGEIAYGELNQLKPAQASQELFDYQIIRSSIRGSVMIADKRETVVWHESQCLKLWARIDALRITQKE
jgi:hypothetical protein